MPPAVAGPDLPQERIAGQQTLSLSQVALADQVFDLDLVTGREIDQVGVQAIGLDVLEGELQSSESRIPVPRSVSTAIRGQPSGAAARIVSSWASL